MAFHLLRLKGGCGKDVTRHGQHTGNQLNNELEILDFIFRFLEATGSI